MQHFTISLQYTTQFCCNKTFIDALVYNLIAIYINLLQHKRLGQHNQFMENKPLLICNPLQFCCYIHIKFLQCKLKIMITQLIRYNNVD